MDSTSASLLERLRHPEQQTAWTRFVQLYTPMLFHWARRLGLQDDDAADLVQDICIGRAFALVGIGTECR